MKPSRCLLSFALLLFSFSLPAQSPNRTGKVVDAGSGEPIPFAAVVHKSKVSGTHADADGKFSLLALQETDTLEVTAFGYEKQTVVYRAGETFMEVQMREQVVNLDEVVITGTSGSSSSYERVAVESYSISHADLAEIKGVEISSSGRKRSKGKSARTSVTTYSWGDGAAPAEETSASAGQLTAGELNDFSKWELWQDIGTTELANYRSTWKMRPEHRYVVQVQTPAGMPVVDARVKLSDADGKHLWSARTDNTGKAELWYQPLTMDSVNPGQLQIGVEHKRTVARVDSARAFHAGINTVTLAVPCESPGAVDIAFVVDATSSMSDEIAYLKAELRDIIQKAQNTLPDKDLRLGSVFYRDEGDEYLTRHSAFTDDLGAADKFIGGQEAGGGGDFPEAVHEGLGVALEKLQWREEAAARILFLLLDAPAHTHKAAEMHRLTELAASKGVRIVPVVASGIDKSAEYLLRSMALLCNGTYVFLTDDSGIGGSHIKPTTDKFEVETLNEILLRVIFQYTQTIACEQEQSPVTGQETLMVALPKGDQPSANEGPIRSQEQQVRSERDWIKGSKDSPAAWKYWPNPTSGPLSVEARGTMGMLLVTDLSGKLLERHAVPEGAPLQLELGRYPAGTYYLKYEYEQDRWLSGKVVLVK